MLKAERFYNKNYKKLLLIPIIIMIIALVLIGQKYSTTGDFLNKDVTLKGGITATIYTDKEVDIDQLQSSLGVDCTIRKLTDLSTGRQLGIIVEVADLTDEELESALSRILSIELTEQNYSVESTGSALGESFYKELLIAIGFAFLFMAIVVFVTFRTLIPSLAIVQAAFADLVITLAIINLAGIKISTAGIVAFLLVLGYSIDTDILLTTKVLKRTEGRVFERMINAAKTGLTMTGTTLSVLFVAYIFSASPVLKQMFMIILIALFVDIFTTYLTNTGLLKIYCERKGME